MTISFPSPFTVFAEGERVPARREGAKSLERREGVKRFEGGGGAATAQKPSSGPQYSEVNVPALQVYRATL